MPVLPVVVVVVVLVVVVVVRRQKLTADLATTSIC